MMAFNGTLHQAPLRVVVFDNMRTRSHLFSRLFSEHSNFSQVWHPFLMTAFLGPELLARKFQHSESRHKEITEDMKPLYENKTYGSSQHELATEVARVEASASGKNIWISEHCNIVTRQEIVLAQLNGHQYTPETLGPNPTYCPDWLFETCTPIMIIRNPALSIPSFHRSINDIQRMVPSDDDFKFCTSLHYSRLLFDLFKSQGRTPIVVDGEDVISRRKEMTDRVCAALGCDPNGVVEEWQPTPKEQQSTNPVIYTLLKSIHDSHGIIFPAQKFHGPVDVQQVAAELVERYGESIAGSLEGHIDLNMPDYEYLKQFAV